MARTATVFILSLLLNQLIIHVSQTEKSVPLERTVKYMFSDKQNNGQRSCSWLRPTRKQRRMCRKDPGVNTALWEAQQLAISHCKDQFQYERWNCSMKAGNTSILEKSYRETAFITAISVAAIVNSVARACASGSMVRCPCVMDRDQELKEKFLKLGICDDNTRFARRFTRNFLQMRTLGKGHTLERRNAEVGIQVVSSGVEKICKCHGVSGACNLKTCWHRLPGFTVVAAELKKRYIHAIKYSQNNAASENLPVRAKLPPNSTLMYLEHSPTFCSRTRGRKCENTANCETLCCGRGFNHQLINNTKRCYCRIKTNSCCEVQCRTCTYQSIIYTCK